MRIVFHLVTGPNDIVEYAPLGFGYLTSFLHSQGIDAKCSVETDVDTILMLNPDIIGLSCSSQNYGRAIELARNFKERCRSHIVIGGLHITVLPESLDAAFTCGVMSEGEDTFHHLVRVLQSTGDLTPENMREIPGLVFLDRGELVVNPERALIDVLDLIPPPDRTILPEAKYTHIMTGRGCPYECAFCASRAMWGGYRGFSVRRVTDELIELIEQGHERIHIHDDLFVADLIRLIGIADALEEEEMLGAVELSCTVRADLVTEGLAEILVRLNVVSVTFGLESCNDETNWRLHKNYDATRIRRALEILNRFGIEVICSGIIGEPEETMESMRDTYSFIMEQALIGRIAGAEINVLAPFPGTDYWPIAVERGMIGPLKHFDWSRLGAPWHGLLLNRHIEVEAGRLVAWDQTMRAMFAALHRPLIMFAPDDVDLDLEMDVSLLRAIFLIADEPDVEELIDQGEIDLLRLSAPQALLQIKELVNHYGKNPLALIAPEPARATSAVVRAAKVGLTLGGKTAMRTRIGEFPLMLRMAELTEWTSDDFAELVGGDASKLPGDIPVAQPQQLRQLPLGDLSRTVGHDGSVTEFLDRYAAMLKRDKP